MRRNNDRSQLNPLEVMIMLIIPSLITHFLFFLKDSGSS